ncbi:hypothetical protein, partial [Klebsiella quasipneumoniae]|uniref:hypothetical protein n=1 Tax=Klebsiella quasipneumoniae TaxID=1463165 RepID=UPI001940381E
AYKLSTAQAGEFPGSRRSALPGLPDQAHHCTGSVGPRKRSAAGHGHSQGAACMPGGGYALPGLQTKHSASRGISRVAAFRLTRATGQCKQ